MIPEAKLYLKAIGRPRPIRTHSISSNQSQCSPNLILLFNVIDLIGI